MKYINKCIPPQPFNIHPFEREGPAFQKWIASETDDKYKAANISAEPSEVGSWMAFFKITQERELVVSKRKNAKPTYEKFYILSKKWLPFLELKKKIESGQISNSGKKRKLELVSK